MNLEEFKRLSHDYLGDGAYVGDAGQVYVIITTDGITIQNEICLGAYEIKALNNFIASRKDA